MPPSDERTPRWNRATQAAARPAAVADDDGPPVLAGERYEIGGELGRGGMGRVLAAHDTTLHREVAIKQALSDDARAVVRFEREARITARLGHPAIVPVFDLGRDATGRPYYTMRRIEGEPLGELVAAAAGVRERLALLPNALAAIDAAAFAHARGVIHRDIKPWNILVGAHGETLLIDWGLARELAEDGPTDKAGTPGFMAPEQARGEPVDARADVYALGATLRHVVGEGDGVSPDLRAIVAKATAEDRAARYADAGELAADVRRFLAGQLVAAHRYTARERFAKLVRRHEIAALTIALASVAIVVIGVLAIVNVVHERDLAEAARQDAVERGDQLLVDRAAAFAERDPTRAAALLANLPAESRSWPLARDVLAVAAAHGIAHGARPHHGAITTLALAPDGRRVLTAGTDGDVHVLDLAAGTDRVVQRTADDAVRAIWLDDRRIAIANSPELVTVDLATGAVTRLDRARPITTLWTAGGAVRYLDDKSGELLENGRVIATGVRDVVPAGDAALVIAGGAVHLLAHGALTKLAAPAPYGVDRAGSRDRIAAVIDDRIVEWSVATGGELRSIPVPPGWRITELAYGRTGLIAARSDGRHREVVALATGAILLEGTWSMLWHAIAPAGDVLVGDDGTLAIVGAGFAHRIAVGRSGLRGVVATPDGRIAIGSGDGTLLWWTAADIVPRELPTGMALAPCAFAGGRLVGMQASDLVALDLASGATALRVDVRGTSCAPFVIGGRAFALEGSRLTEAVDLASGQRARWADESVLADVPAGQLYAVANERLTRRTPTGDVVERLHAQGLAAFAGRRVLLEAGWLVRDSAAAAGTLPVQLPLDALAIDGEGTVWFVRDHALWRWTRGAPVRSAELQTAVAGIQPRRAGGITVALRDGSLWFATAAGAVERVPPGAHRIARIGERVAVVQEPRALTVVLVATGQRVVYPLGSVNGAVALSADETAVGLATPTRPSYALVYTDRVPRECAAARAWLARATNATLTPGTDAIVWK